jgi:predicted nucleotidyltransferase
MLSSKESAIIFGQGDKMMNQEIYKRLRKISDRLKKESHAEKVILYGSYATGEATEDSDIDLFIIAPTNERFFERMATVRGLIRELRNGLPVSPIVLTPEEVEKRRRKGDQFVQQILEEGIIL